ncbi:MAG: CHAT domain-containing protein [Saprospiraceae bacterium]|nr:CHAT domain-containing protein [Saprospiraceae bacterium]
MKATLLGILTLLTTVLFAQQNESACIEQVDSLIRISRERTNDRQYDEAQKIHAQAEDIAVTCLGTHSSAYASCCFNQARIMDFQRNFPEAERWYLSALKLRGEVSGSRHLEYTSILNNLGALYVNLGQFEQSEAMFLEALEILETMFGKDHQEYIETQNNLGILYRTMGDYERALPLFLSVQEKGKKIWGPDHLYYSICLHSLGNLYQSTGQYEQAEICYQQSKEIWGNQLGKDHPYYTASLNNLAILYKNLGNLEKAEELLIESNAIRKKVMGEKDPEYALGLKSLANLYKHSGEYAKADSLYLLAGQYLDQSLHGDSPDYAMYLSDYAAFEQRMGKYGHAEKLFRRSIDIIRAAYGDQNVHYAIGLNNLAWLYVELNKLEEAEQLLLKSHSILVDVFGREHPETAIVLRNLVKLYAAGEEFEQMGNYLVELSLVEYQNIRDGMHHLSEEELEKYLNKYSGFQDLTMALAHQTQMQHLVDLCFDSILTYKGMLLESVMQVRRRAVSEPGIAEIYHRMVGCQRRLSRFYAQPLVDRDSVLLETTRAQAEALEKQLARRIAGYGEAFQNVQWQDVKAALGLGEAALEIIRFRQQLEGRQDCVLYAALLLLPDQDGPLWITLCAEEPLERVLFANGERRADFVNQLYSFSGRGMVRVEEPLKTLHELIWKPLERHLSAIKTIYYSPSGLLHRVNLGAIPLDKQSTLADRHQLIQVNSTRQIGRPYLTESEANHAALFGGIQYDMDSTSMISDNAAQVSAEWRTSNLDKAILTDTSFQVLTWPALNWTLDEVTAIDAHLSNSGFSTTLYTASGSSEDAFLSLGQTDPAPRVIHLATHGFFFPDLDRSFPGGSDFVAYEPAFQVSDHPLIRSGLILSGGNYAWQHGRAVRPDREDGILTAYEISLMDLSHTELVVLSACETGLGDIQGNEGVYGLQRAFKIAGAKYLIMSLWQVPDRQTMQFMTTFYGHWLEGEMTIPEAFRKTQLEMRDRFFDAYNWAGFVLVE